MPALLIARDQAAGKLAKSASVATEDALRRGLKGVLLLAFECPCHQIIRQLTSPVSPPCLKQSTAQLLPAAMASPKQLERASMGAAWVAGAAEARDKRAMEMAATEILEKCILKKEVGGGG